MMTALCSFFGALIARLLAAELYAWVPALADLLLRLYVQFLPEEVGERLLEEWRSLLHDTPGNLMKLARALDLGRTLIFTKAEARELNNKIRQVRNVEKSNLPGPRIILSELKTEFIPHAGHDLRREEGTTDLSKTREE